MTTIDSEPAIRRRLRALLSALSSVGDHPCAKDIGKAVAAQEERLVDLRGSERAYQIVEDIRVAVTFGDSSPTTDSGVAARDLDALIQSKECELGAALAGSATITDLRRINDQLTNLVAKRRELLTSDHINSIVRNLKERELLP